MEKLLENFLNPALYGVGGAKTWQSLLQEVERGECIIDLSGARPIRQIEVVSIDVVAPNGDRFVPITARN